MRKSKYGLISYLSQGLLVHNLIKNWLLYFTVTKVWEMTSGWCLNCASEDQNEGTITSREGDEESCLNKCKSFSAARGCEYDGTTCTIHTRDVLKGSGDGRYKCWTLSNSCPGKWQCLLHFNIFLNILSNSGDRFDSIVLKTQILAKFANHFFRSQGKIGNDRFPQDFKNSIRFILASPTLYGKILVIFWQKKIMLPITCLPCRKIKHESSY